MNKSLQKRELSRSKLELYLDCQRCFYDEVVLGHKRIGTLPLTLNNAVDTLLKAEFDAYRHQGTPHPLCVANGLKAVPFNHPDLGRWRHNFTGVRWSDPVTGWSLFGAIDDVWQTPAGSLLVVDYKATARKDDVTAAQIYDSYKRQVAMYQYLLESEGFIVDSRAYFVYANGISNVGTFGDVLKFRTTLLPCDVDRSWVPEEFRAAVSLVTGGTRPAASDNCDWCAYIAARGGTR